MGTQKCLRSTVLGMLISSQGLYHRDTINPKHPYYGTRTDVEQIICVLQMPCGRCWNFLDSSESHLYLPEIFTNGAKNFCLFWWFQLLKEQRYRFIQWEADLFMCLAKKFMNMSLWSRIVSPHISNVSSV